MSTVQMHLHLTEEAAQLLEKYCTKRTRGAFLSELVVAYDQQQKGGDRIIEALRREAADASRRASQLVHALKAAEQEQYPLPTNLGKKKRR